MVRVLGIVGSPRRGGNTEALIREALNAAREVPNTETRLLILANKKINQCLGCYKCSEKNDLCIFQFQDDMHEVYKEYLWADGLIIGSPVFHLSVPGILKNAIDRLGMGLISKYRESGLPFFCKVGGVIAQGTGKFGGQEYTMQYLINHLLLMNNIVISPDSLIGIGVAASFQDKLVREPGAIVNYDSKAVVHSRVLGKRIAEVAKIVKAGIETLRIELRKGNQKHVSFGPK